jgi:hypothetical protein
MAKRAATDPPPQNNLPATPAFPEITFINLPLVISAAATFLLCTSVSYQLGYLSVLGSGLMPFFTVQDAIVGSLALVPFFVVTLPLAFILVSWMPFKAPPTKPASSRLVAPILYLFGAVVWLALGVLDNAYGGFMLGAICMLLSLMILVTDKGYTHPFFLSFILFMIVLVAAFGLGGIEAKGQLAEQGRNYLLKTKEGSRCVQLLKAGSEIILVQELNGLVSVIPNSQVEMLRREGDLPRPSQLTFAKLRAWIGGKVKGPKVSTECIVQN